MFPNQCPARDGHGEQCAYTTHDGAHTYEMTNAEAAAAQILDSLTPTELATLEAALDATGDIRASLQETFAQRETDHTDPATQ